MLHGRYNQPTLSLLYLSYTFIHEEKTYHCSASRHHPAQPMSPSVPAPQRFETATLGGGCFWCLDAAYRQINSVGSVISGYATGAEVVQITFDASIITYRDILDIFWVIHDPTTLNRQNYDIGPQYRSIILYGNEDQRRLAEDSRTAIQKLWPNPVVTEIVPLESFETAPEYHQNFFRKHPQQAYCQIVINPKLAKLREKFKNKLKPD